MWCFKKGSLRFHHAYNPCIRRICQLADDVATRENDISRSNDTTGARPFNEIPGPKSLAFIGSLWQYLPIYG
jgi:hypothetical protein